MAIVLLAHSQVLSFAQKVFYPEQELNTTDEVPAYLYFQSSLYPDATSPHAG